MSGPLAGVRVLDLTTVVMGPFATQILGDLGADVIKVESPGGDSMRRVGPFKHADMGPLYLQANRNKRSIVLDLKDARGKAKLLALVPTADVLVYNIRPQAMRRLGLDYASLAAVNPSIIVCGAYGFGEGGPYAGRPAYDDIMQAASGVCSLFERIDGKPRYAPINVCDRSVGMYLAMSLLAALFHRAKTGEGQSIELPMFETMAQFFMNDHIGGAVFSPPIGPTGYKRLLSRFRGPFPTADGHMCAVVYTDDHWRRFCAALGLPDMVATDPRFKDLATRTHHSDDIGAFLYEHMPKKSTAEWMAFFKEHDIPAHPVTSLDQLFDDPHLNAVGFWEEREHPTEGKLRVTRFPGTWSKTQPSTRRLAPTRGEHTEEVLREIGWKEH